MTNTHQTYQLLTHVDVKTLDEAGLRSRLELLAKEFESRSQLEALKMSQSLSQLEAETSNKYLRLMLQQRSGEYIRVML